MFLGPSLGCDWQGQVTASWLQLIWANLRIRYSSWRRDAHRSGLSAWARLRTRDKQWFQCPLHRCKDGIPTSGDVAFSSGLSDVGPRGPQGPRADTAARPGASGGFGALRGLGSEDGCRQPAVRVARAPPGLSWQLRPGPCAHPSAPLSRRPGWHPGGAATPAAAQPPAAPCLWVRVSGPGREPASRCPQVPDTEAPSPLLEILFRGGRSFHFGVISPNHLFVVNTFTCLTSIC